MKRLATAVVVAVLLAAGPIALGAAPAGNLWVGVIVDEALIPVGALVDGTWWFRGDSNDDLDHNSPAIGKTPPEWRPLGRAVPAAWLEHPLTGGQRPLQITEPLEIVDEASLQVGFPIGVPAPKGKLRVLETTQGVAVSGQVTVRLFTEIPEEQRPADVLRALMAPSLKAARTAVTAEGRSSAENSRAWAELPDTAITGGSFNVEDMRSIAQGDGATLYYVEQSKAPMADCEVHVRATVVKSRAGRLSVTAVDGESRCDNYLNLEPLAILERGGRSCWLTAQLLEDGRIYTLTRPGISYVFDGSACDIK